MQQDQTEIPPIAVGTDPAPQPPSARGAPHVYAALDSWRGISACMIVFTHVPAVGDVSSTLLIKGSYLFTDFFFVLSGFIIFENY